MRYLLFFLVVILIPSGCTDVSGQVSTAAEPSIVENEKKSMNSDPVTVKAYVDKIQIGMEIETVRKITGIDENEEDSVPCTAPNRLIRHYDYDNSYITVVYSFDFENIANPYFVVEKMHTIDNLTIEQRKKKRNESYTQCWQKRKAINERNKERLAYEYVKSWRSIEVNKSVSQLSNLIDSTNWQEEAIVQKISFQTGIWNVWAESGHTVFRIYPFLKDHRGADYNYGIVIKINVPNIDMDEFIKEANKSDSKILVTEYSTFGHNATKNIVSLDKYVPKSP